MNKFFLSADLNNYLKIEQIKIWCTPFLVPNIVEGI